MKRRSRAVPAAIASALVFVGCGTHVLVGEGTAPAPAALDDGGSHPPPDLDGGAIACAGTVCAPSSLADAVLAPCCYSGSKCGALLPSACVEIDAEGTIDPGCPAFATYPGCCKPDGTCGLIASGTPFGCVNPFAFFPVTSLGLCTPPDN
jgi:hypothetical protein